jgi:hypothetical protein
MYFLTSLHDARHASTKCVRASHQILRRFFSQSYAAYLMRDEELNLFVNATVPFASVAETPQSILSFRPPKSPNPPVG